MVASQFWSTIVATIVAITVGVTIGNLLTLVILYKYLENVLKDF